jgi:hypothetical protein
VSDQGNIPVLTDLIERGSEITMSDLGLDDDLETRDDDAFFDNPVIDVTAPGFGAADPFRDNPALEYAIQSILDEHMELAWQEIKLAIQRELNKPGS